MDQNIGVKGYLGAKFTFLASMGIGFGNNGDVKSLQQIEALRDFIGGNRPSGFRLGASLGFRREFNNDKVALSRIAAAYENINWRFGGNVRFEKAFDKDRDGVDVISSIGIHRQISGELFGGIEAIGKDLEGIWENDEAEGGARLLVGTSLNFTPVTYRFSLTI